MIESEILINDSENKSSRRKNDNEQSMPLLMSAVKPNEELIKSQNMTLLEQSMQYEKQIYDLKQLLDIAQSFCSTLNFKNLLESIVYICMAQMHVLGAEIFTKDLITSETFILSTAENANAFDSASATTIPYNSPVTEKLLELNSPIDLDGLKRALKKASFEKYEESKEILAVFENLSPTLIVPLIQGKHLNGILVLQERIAIDDDVSYTEYEKTQIMSIASLASVAINNASLLEMSSTDSMTHLRLKYYFFNTLTDKMERLESAKRKLAVLMFDIDFFKRFNDTYGHECGDYVLITVAKLIKDNLRETDVASRYGGEEFTALLENTTKDEAIKVAERIRSKIDSHEFVYGGMKLHVTISAGVALYSKRTSKNKDEIITPAQLVDQADKALYVSKGTGRNKVSLYKKTSKGTNTIITIENR